MRDELPGSGWQDTHAAVGRLEDVLARLPFDRALPDLAVLLQLADVRPGLVADDERARKVLHEAILARPLSTPDAVARHRTEVDVLLLEVGMLTDVLHRAAAASGGDDAGGDAGGHAAGADDRVRDAVARLAHIRERLAELRRDL